MENRRKRLKSRSTNASGRMPESVNPDIFCLERERETCSVQRQEEQTTLHENRLNLILLVNGPGGKLCHFQKD